MAYLGQKNSGSRYLQFEDRYRNVRTISIGKVSKRMAQTIKIHVEELVFAHVAGTSPSDSTTRWLTGIGDKLSDKLSKCGLINQRGSTTLGTFITDYVAKRSDVADSTKRKWRKTHCSLLEYFGDSKPLQAITRGDATQWRRVVKATGRAENTVRSWVKIAKSLFNDAVAHRLIDENPFAGLESTLVKNTKREHFVTHEDAKKVLSACPNAKWRLIFALARYGGLRVPSEIQALKWSDILWDQKRFIVTCKKTEHLPGHEKRIVPIFRELAPHLEDAFDEAPEGTLYVIPRGQNESGNYRTTMKRIIKQAGLEPWEKLFQNLRSSCETELADMFPIKAVCEWIGNSEAVAKNHYLQVTEEHFEAAASGTRALNYALSTLSAQP